MNVWTSSNQNPRHDDLNTMKSTSESECYLKIDPVEPTVNSVLSGPKKGLLTGTSPLWINDNWWDIGASKIINGFGAMKLLYCNIFSTPAWIFNLISNHQWITLMSVVWLFVIVGLCTLHTVRTIQNENIKTLTAYDKSNGCDSNDMLLIFHKFNISIVNYIRTNKQPNIRLTRIKTTRSKNDSKNKMCAELKIDKFNKIFKAQQWLPNHLNLKICQNCYQICEVIGYNR